MPWLLPQGGDDDIDALLAAMKVQDVKKVVIEDECPPPSARSCACFVPHSAKVSCYIGAFRQKRRCQPSQL